MSRGEDSALIADPRDAAAFSQLGVMRGLDPRIHEAAQRPGPYRYHLLRFIMDCRVKPGKDAWRGQRINRGRS
jgi:hypothetical protein